MSTQFVDVLVAVTLRYHRKAQLVVSVCFHLHHSQLLLGMIQCPGHLTTVYRYVQPEGKDLYCDHSYKSKDLFPTQYNSTLSWLRGTNASSQINTNLERFKHFSKITYTQKEGKLGLQQAWNCRSKTIMHLPFQGLHNESKAWVKILESVGANQKISHYFLLNCGSSCTHTFATTSVFSKQLIT